MSELQNSEILEEVKKALSKHLDVNIEMIRENSKLVDDLGADSLDFVELAMVLEEKFGLEIPDEDVGKFTNVKSIVDYITNSDCAQTLQDDPKL